MRVRGKLLPEEIREIGTFLRSKWYWPKLLLRSWYGLLLFAALVWGTATKIIAGNREHWLALSVVWLCVAAIFIWAFFNTRRERRRDIQVLNQRLPDWLILDEQGLQTQNRDGRTSSRPWKTLTNWWEGKAVIFLALTEASSYVFLPLSDLNEIEADNLRAILHKHLGEQQRQ